MTEKRIYKDEKDADHTSIHLMVNSVCTNRCPDCCNLQYDLDSVPVITVEELKNAKEIMLTGSEPFLMKGICDFCVRLREQYPNIEQLYIYTSGKAMLKRARDWARPAAPLFISGINFSPKSYADEVCIKEIFRNSFYRRILGYMQSHRFILMPYPGKKTDDDEFIRDLGIVSDNFVAEGFPSLVNIEKRDFQEEFQPNGGVWRRLPIFMDETVKQIYD